MMDDEIQTSEIREKAPGFDRRDRTARGFADSYAGPGDALLAEVDVDPMPFPGIGRRLARQIVAFAGEHIQPGELVELENGLWWRVRRK